MMICIGLVAGQVLFSTDELKRKAGIPTKGEWAARYKVVPMEGPVPPGVPEYDPLLGAGQYNSKALLACMSPLLLPWVLMFLIGVLLVSLCVTLIRWRIRLLPGVPRGLPDDAEAVHDV